MRRTVDRGWWLAMALCLGGAAEAWAAAECEEELRWVGDETQRYFLVLAGREDVFYDGSGPAFVMLMKVDTGAQEADVGAVGVYAEEPDGRAAFGAVPPDAYEPFFREPDAADGRVMLRLEISAPQYERVLAILRTWDRRARERALLYPDDIFMNNILLVKQATEELNRCRQTVDLYALDWGLDDEISEHNVPSRVPLLYFEELRRRNPARHVADARMPAEALSLADAEPAPPRRETPASVGDGSDEPAAPPPVAAPSGGHHHHHHHHHP